MKTRHGDLVAISATALVCAAVVVLHPIAGVRAPFAVLLSLVLPGYAVTSAAFARHHLGAARLLLLTLAMSLSVLATGSLALQGVPGGLRTGSWTVLLLLVILIGCAAAALRRSPEAVSRTVVRLPRPRLFDAALLASAGFFVAGAFALGRAPLSAPNVEGYTQLWMLPAGTATEPGVRFGVKSGELLSQRYRLDLWMGLSGPIRSARFTLRPAQSFDWFVPVRSPRGQMSSSRRLVQVFALLYRLDRPNIVYRRVFVWLPSGA